MTTNPDEHDTARPQPDDVRGPLQAFGEAVFAGGGESEPQPREIGGYRIVDFLGRGGFGVVYLAQRVEPFEQDVAIKVIRPGLATGELRERFDRERQALASMDHPGIARVLDGGETGEGQPYLVMEYVRGEPITDYCNRHGLDVHARLDLFVGVCDAVQHAHAKGVVHRDLKPGNVLVADVDGAPVPKVIDFGIAKVLDEQADPRARFTRDGAMIGTLEYMSPEQAAGENDLVDTRTDVYALGAMLYELLTGAPPFLPTELRDRAYDEVIRDLRDIMPEPPRRRLRSRRRAGVGETPPTGVRTVRRELDWICLRCLEKMPGRRYQAASELAADIRALQTGKPIRVGPRWEMPRVIRLAATHYPVVAATIFGFLAGFWFWQGIFAEWAAMFIAMPLIAVFTQAAGSYFLGRRVRFAWGLAGGFGLFMLGFLATALTMAVGGGLTDSIVVGAVAAFAALFVVLVTAAAIVARVVSVGFGRAIRLMLAIIVGSGVLLAGVHLVVVSAAGWLNRDVGVLDEPTRDGVLPKLNVRSDDEALEWRLAEARAANKAIGNGNWEEAVRLYQSVLAEPGAAGLWPADLWWMHHHNLGLAQYKLGRFSESEDSLRRAFSGRRTDLGPDRELTLMSATSLAAVLMEIDSEAEYLRLAREAFVGLMRIGPDEPFLVEQARATFGLALMYAGDYAAAERYLFEAVESYKIRRGSGHAEVARLAMFASTVAHLRFQRTGDWDHLRRERMMIESLAGFVEAESLEGRLGEGVEPGVQDMQGFAEGVWSGDTQLFVRAPGPGDVFELDVPVESGGVKLYVRSTSSYDYGIVEYIVDGEPGPQLDLRSDLAKPTNLIDLGVHRAEDGILTVRCRLVAPAEGDEPPPGNFFGIDCFIVVPVNASTASTESPP
ncbi:MAG: protein kinase [Planctomycetes bacterium]|nr:protein kinase [Planctomycetota bacterium]